MHLKSVIFSVIFVSFLLLYFPEVHAAATSRPVEITELDSDFVANGYSILRKALVSVLVKNVGVEPDEAESAVNAFSEFLAMLGEAAEKKAEEKTIQDAHAEIWESEEFTDVLMRMLAPFDMDDLSKTKNLMRLSRDMKNLGDNPTDGELRGVMMNYLGMETTDAAMVLINKGKLNKCNALDFIDFSFRSGLNLNFSPDNKSCVSQNDVVGLVELHYSRKLPKLTAFIDGVEDWINDRENTGKLVELGFAGLSLSKMITAAKSDAAQKIRIEKLLEESGIDKGIFWYIINSGP